MRISLSTRLVVRVLLLGALLLALPLCIGAFEMKLCESCRRNWDDSPARLRVMRDFGKRTKAVHVCSPLCVARELERNTKGEVGTIQIVEWNKRHELNPILINVKIARFLVGIKGDEEKMPEPFAAAFSNERQAREFRDELGGELQTWEKLLERCRKLASEEEPPSPGREYQPLRHNRD